MVNRPRREDETYEQYHDNMRREEQEFRARNRDSSFRPNPNVKMKHGLSRTGLRETLKKLSVAITTKAVKKINLLNNKEK